MHFVFNTLYIWRQTTDPILQISEILKISLFILRSVMEAQLMSSHVWICGIARMITSSLWPLSMYSTFFLVLLKCSRLILGQDSIQVELIFTVQRFHLSCTGHTNSQLLTSLSILPFFIWSGTFVGLFTGHVTHLNPPVTASSLVCPPRMQQGLRGRPSLLSGIRWLAAALEKGTPDWMVQ